MDATLKGNEAILVRENIDGYPSLILYRNGISEGTYSGPRTSRSVQSLEELSTLGRKQ